MDECSGPWTDQLLNGNPITYVLLQDLYHAALKTPHFPPTGDGCYSLALHNVDNESL